MTSDMTLYHYTCEHAVRRIGRYGTLIPQPQPALKGAKLVWLTDQETPNRAALCLTSHLLSCDRLAHRYLVTDLGSVVPWRGSEWQHLGWAALELADGADPSHWFVSAVSLPAVLDRAYRP